MPELSLKHIKIPVQRYQSHSVTQLSVNTASGTIRS